MHNPPVHSIKHIAAPLHGILSPLPMLGSPPSLSAASMFALAFKSNFIGSEYFFMATAQSGVWPLLKADHEFAFGLKHWEDVGEEGRF